MFEVSKSIHFSYGHRLLKHEGKCKHLHGHNAVVQIECHSERLNDKSMVVDFDEISSSVKSWINANLDHRMILNEKDPLIETLKGMNEPFYVIQGDPTAEFLSKTVYEIAKKSGLPVKSVTLWETPTSSASYRE